MRSRMLKVATFHPFVRVTIEWRQDNFALDKLIEKKR
jgi:hypothetical protein